MAEVFFGQKNQQPGGDPQKQMLKIINLTIVLSLLIWGVGTCFYQVKTDSVGVTTRFGKYTRTTQPGLHLKMPFGIENVVIVPVTYIFKDEFGFKTVRPGVRTEFSTSSRNAEESTMLTGDLNVANVEWVVQYRVKDPVHYAFNVRNLRDTIRNVSESVMRLVIGDYSANAVLTSGRDEIKEEHKQLLQEILDKYEAGIKIERVLLQDVTPPPPVRPSFNEVNEARQERERMINQAWEEFNRVIPKAKGEAEKKIRKAEGYYQYRVNAALGDASRFISNWEAYKMAKEVTRKRIYLETMNEVLPSIEQKIIIDRDIKSLLPLLNLSSPNKAGGE